MLGKSPNQSQKNLFSPVLKEIINPQEPLASLQIEFPGRIWRMISQNFIPIPEPLPCLFA
ncbi:MAG: hypothetical protein LC120_01965 [Bacteroidales bacterium]|nr:hypothetical protein [Bacteroidales bacterium]MCZ2281868.1 hypothetical protein [Bacteroidales bacterium]